jgi:hypothetical protein
LLSVFEGSIVIATGDSPKLIASARRKATTALLFWEAGSDRRPAGQ